MFYATCSWDLLIKLCRPDARHRQCVLCLRAPRCAVFDKEPPKCRVLPLSTAFDQSKSLPAVADLRLHQLGFWIVSCFGKKITAEVSRLIILHQRVVQGGW